MPDIGGPRRTRVGAEEPKAKEAGFPWLVSLLSAALGASVVFVYMDSEKKALKKELANLKKSLPPAKAEGEDEKKAEAA